MSGRIYQNIRDPDIDLAKLGVIADATTIRNFFFKSSESTVRTFNDSLKQVYLDSNLLAQPSMADVLAALAIYPSLMKTERDFTSAESSYLV